MRILILIKFQKQQNFYCLCTPIDDCSLWMCIVWYTSIELVRYFLHCSDASVASVDGNKQFEYQSVFHTVDTVTKCERHEQHEDQMLVIKMNTNWPSSSSPLRRHRCLLSIKGCAHKVTQNTILCILIIYWCNAVAKGRENKLGRLRYEYIVESYDDNKFCVILKSFGFMLFVFGLLAIDFSTCFRRL